MVPPLPRCGVMKRGKLLTIPSRRYRLPGYLSISPVDKREHAGHGRRAAPGEHRRRCEGEAFHMHRTASVNADARRPSLPFHLAHRIPKLRLVL